MEPKTFVALPVEVQAVQWTGEFADLPRHWRTKNALHMVGGRLIVETVHGPLPAEIGDFLVLGVSNEFYPMPRATFAYRYAEADK
jgi:hypothetical protein